MLCRLFGVLAMFGYYVGPLVTLAVFDYVMYGDLSHGVPLVTLAVLGCVM